VAGGGAAVRHLSRRESLRQQGNLPLALSEASGLPLSRQIATVSRQRRKDLLLELVA